MNHEPRTLKQLIDSYLINSDSLDIQTAVGGGVVSNVYSAKFNGMHAIVKRTEDFHPNYPSEVFISKEMHDVDTTILALLENTVVRVPQIFKNIQQDKIVIMENLSSIGFELLSNIIAKGNLRKEYGGIIGKALAELILESRSWPQLNLVETAQSSLIQRGLELRLAYPNDQTAYDQLEHEFTSPNDWVWADCHPKNIFINDCGQCAFIDFGESFYGDHRYMLPNYVAHIFINAFIGRCDENVARDHILSCINAYRNKLPLDECLFCRYVSMEILHRSFGRWIDGVIERGHKTLLIGIGLDLYENADTVLFFIEKLNQKSKK